MTRWSRYRYTFVFDNKKMKYISDLEDGARDLRPGGKGKPSRRCRKEEEARRMGEMETSGDEEARDAKEWDMRVARCPSGDGRLYVLFCMRRPLPPAVISTGGYLPAPLWLPRALFLLLFGPSRSGTTKDASLRGSFFGSSEGDATHWASQKDRRAAPPRFGQAENRQECLFSENPVRVDVVGLANERSSRRTT